MTSPLEVQISEGRLEISADTISMSISELLPALHSLPDPDKLQLIRILAEDLTGSAPSLIEHVTGSIPIWTPYSAFDAADTLLAALQADDQRLSAHA